MRILSGPTHRFAKLLQSFVTASTHTLACSAPVLCFLFRTNPHTCRQILFAEDALEGVEAAVAVCKECQAHAASPESDAVFLDQFSGILIGLQYPLIWLCTNYFCSVLLGGGTKSDCFRTQVLQLKAIQRRLLNGSITGLTAGTHSQVYP